ncbi:MAG: ComF family protein [Campylobacterales bacterium]|nr:ComF family protein [Campylobacterales bacterium]
MRCLLCECLSLPIICKKCQDIFLKPTITKRELDNSLFVYSFYKYENIKDLIFTKHTQIGHKVYKILAQNSFLRFAQNFENESLVYSIGIDEHTRSDYSHVSILSKALKSKTIKPVFSKLIAQNRVNYSGQSLDFRLKNRRNFKYKYKQNIDVILVDDIITTGLTITEATMKLKEYGVNVMFALTLADARSSS